MKKITLVAGIGVVALAVGGVAIAQQAAERAGHRMMADPLGNATITRAEAQTKAVEMFTRLDVTKDGKLDKADREAAMATRLDEHFTKIDSNRDGKIDKAEFTAAHSQAMEPDRMGPERMGPERMGPDRMGHGMGHGMGRMMGGRGMMGAMDANRDSAITRDEFIAGALKRFEAADANKDGKLTPEERRSAMRTHMGAMRQPPAPPAPAPAAK